MSSNLSIGAAVFTYEESLGLNLGLDYGLKPCQLNDNF